MCHRLYVPSPQYCNLCMNLCITIHLKQLYHMNVSGNELGYAESVTPSRGSQNIKRLKLYRCNEKLQQRMIQV